VAHGDGFDATCLTFDVGPAEVKLTPTGVDPTRYIPDSPFLARTFTGPGLTTMTGFTTGGASFKLNGPNLAGLTLSSTPILTAPSPVPSPPPYDECGAWLQSVEQDGSVVRGWYHSEKACDYSNHFQTHMSVSYAQSTNSGSTWTKTDYPNNVVLTGSNAPCPEPCEDPPYKTGAGDQSVIRVGDYYYMYFTDTDQAWPDHTPTWGEGLARATVASGGGPGTWSKWYQGSFSEPGLGGQATALILGSAAWSVSRSTTFEQLFAVLANPWITAPGIQVLNSTDGIEWHDDIASPLIHFPDANWEDRVNGGELYAYPSLVPEAGGTDWGASAYLYYMYLHPKEGFDKRYLVRRRVDVTLHDDPVTTPQAVVRLARSYSTTHTDHWVTTAPICDSGLSDPCNPSVTTYAPEASTILGDAKVYTSGGSGLVALQDCYYPPWHDHMISTDTACEGMDRLRTLGWIWSSQPSTITTVRLYRCFNSSNTNHFLSTDSACEGKGTAEFTIGYAPLSAGS
jgi:hypothetical protein